MARFIGCDCRQFVIGFNGCRAGELSPFLLSNDAKADEWTPLWSFMEVVWWQKKEFNEVMCTAKSDHRER